ncbi:MAG: ATP-binding protein [Haloarculaceae archaeon]
MRAAADRRGGPPRPQLFEIAVSNLVENAIEHNDAAEPWVRVRVDADDQRVRVRVADDGPEIPAMEQKVLETGTEDPLQHGSGVGLWLTYWCVSAVGGSIAFDARDPRGNVVTLAFETEAGSSD